MHRRPTASSLCIAGSAPGCAAYCSGGWWWRAASAASSRHRARSADCRQSRRHVLPADLAGAAAPCTRTGEYGEGARQEGGGGQAHSRDSDVSPAQGAERVAPDPVAALLSASTSCVRCMCYTCVDQTGQQQQSHTPLPAPHRAAAGEAPAVLRPPLARAGHCSAVDGAARPACGLVGPAAAAVHWCGSMDGVVCRRSSRWQVLTEGWVCVALCANRQQRLAWRASCFCVPTCRLSCSRF